MNELLKELRGQVLWLTINRPAERNALTTELMHELSLSIAEAQKNRSVRAIVLTGAGDKAFCAGADLVTGDSFTTEGATLRHPYALMLRAAYHCTLPLIARVNGACVAGGMGLLAMCDLAVAASHAKFGLPEVKVGVFPFQVLTVLRGVIPTRHLTRLCLTGEMINSTQALNIGLLNEVSDAAGLDVVLQTMIDCIVDNSPAAIQRGRYAMRQIDAMSFEESISFMESQVGLMSMSTDAKEGIQAFREKRKPIWR